MSKNVSVFSVSIGDNSFSAYFSGASLHNFFRIATPEHTPQEKSCKNFLVSWKPQSFNSTVFGDIRKLCTRSVTDGIAQYTGNVLISF
jgi:hypothetical protein